MPETKAVDCRIPTSDQGWSKWFSQGTEKEDEALMKFPLDKTCHVLYPSIGFLPFYYES